MYTPDKPAEAIATVLSSDEPLAAKESAIEQPRTESNTTKTGY